MGRMDTRASQYAARLVETGWLAAVIVVPVFFNVWSNRVFEPDKLTLLRSITLVMAVGLLAWVVERGRREGDSLRRWLRVPLVAPILVLTAVYVVSSAFSVAPQLSVFGSYQRLQGLYTWLAYLTIFLSIVVLLRRRGQLERLVQAIIVASLPVALYGVIQNRGLDPMPWLGDVTFRVASTMGNSIFVAAFVVVAVPLTVAKVVESMRAIESEGNEQAAAHPSAAVMRAAAYMVLLFVQIVCIVLAQSRGPWIGLLGGLFLMLLIGAVLRPTVRARRLWASVVFVGLGILPAAGLLAFNLAPEGSALAGLRDAPYVGRLGRVLETEGGTGKVRVLIWQGALELATSDPARFLVGYGPESMHVAYNPHYPPELAHYESRNASPDRSHNETLDALVTTGAIGLLAYLALFTLLFLYALKWLGLVAANRERNLFLGFWFVGGLLAVAVFRLWSGGWTFFGVALPFGMMAGLVTYVFLRGLVGWDIPERPARLLVLGLTAALAAHFIEIHFGIAIAATRTLFFTLSAALVVLGGLHADRPELLAEATSSAPAPQQRAKRSRRARRPAREVTPAAAPSRWSASAFIMLVLLATMVFDFFVRAGLDLGTAGRAQELMVLGWLFSLTWAVGSLVLGSEAILAPGGSTRGAGTYVAISLGGFAAYLLLHLLLLGGPAQAGGAGTSSSLLYLYYVALLGILLVWAWVLQRRDSGGERLSRVGALWAYPLVGLVALAVALLTNVNEVRADIYYKEGWAGYHARANDFLARGDFTSASAYFESALRSYDTALGLDPREDYYLLFKGKARLEEADAEAQKLEAAIPATSLAEGFSEYDDPDLRALVTARDDAFQRAVAVLEDARALAPLNTDHYANLGRAFQVWGERTYDAARREERLAKSLEWFDRAIELSPRNAALRTEMATSAFLSGDDEAALALIDEAIALDPEYGRPYRLRATIHREAEDWQAAEDDYQRYVESRDGRGDAVGWSGLAFVLGQQGKTKEAIAANERVLELAGDDLPTLRNLVLLHRDAGNRTEACAFAAQGLAASPEDTGLQQLATDLGCPQPTGFVPADGGAGTGPASQGSP